MGTSSSISSQDTCIFGLCGRIGGKGSCTKHHRSYNLLHRNPAVKKLPFPGPPTPFYCLYFLNDFYSVRRSMFSEVCMQE